MIIFINQLIKNNEVVNETKLKNSIKSTNFNNLKNKEYNEGFEESVYSKLTGKKVNFLIWALIIVGKKFYLVI